MTALGPTHFRGGWRFERKITDHLTPRPLRAKGEVRFEPAGPLCLIYVESGTLEMEGAPAMQTVRRYRWRFGADEVEVFFDDGRPFHRFRPEGQGAGSDHPCGADLYKVSYDFRDPVRWVAVWQVKGPRKDYVSHTVYARA